MISDTSEEAGLSVGTLLTGEVKLASPPEVFLKISEVLDDPSKTPRDVEQVIKHDPGLAARLLRLVNSAFYGFPRQISSISRAITIIGTQELRDLVLATVVVERFSHLPNKLMSMREFWRMSVRNALLAKEMEKHVADSGGLKSVFICGLLHEIGRLVIYARIPELARAAILLVEAENVEERVAEQRTYGFDHYQLAAEMVKRWQLPEVIETTLRCHGNPEAAKHYSRETALVTLASQVSLAGIDTSQQLEQFLPTLDKWLADLKMGEAELSESLAEANAKFEPVFQLFFQGK